MERLRTKVASLESLISNQSQDGAQTLLMKYMETQESARQEQVQANLKLMQVI